MNQLIENCIRLREAHEANPASRYSESWYETFEAWIGAFERMLSIRRN